MFVIDGDDGREPIIVAVTDVVENKIGGYMTVTLDDGTKAVYDKQGIYKTRAAAQKRIDAEIDANYENEHGKN